MSQNAPPEDPAGSPSWAGRVEVDQYGVPLNAFGDRTPPEFFEVVGRILAVNGRIEYLRGRLDHLPPADTRGVRKVEQFLRRDDAGRADRNAIVHSSWVFGANMESPDAILGVRYQIRKLAAGETAALSIRDVPDSDRKQEVVQYKLEGLRKILKRDLATMQVGEVAYTQVMLNWASRQGPIVGQAFDEP